MFGANQRSVSYLSQCDGVRPVCFSCSSRKRECVYTSNPSETRTATLKRKFEHLGQEADNLRSSNATLLELMSLIRSRNAHDAMSIFQRLRAGTDAEAIVSAVREGYLLIQLCVAPEGRFRFTFPFRQEMPQFLLVHAKPYLSSLLFETTAELVGTPQSSTTTTTTSSSSSQSPNDHTHPQFFKPYHATNIIEPRLDVIKPSQWTTVSDNDIMMRALIRLYYQHEYHFLTCFHMEAFLNDMLSGKERFCSSVLVNSILAHACVSSSFCAEVLDSVLLTW